MKITRRQFVKGAVAAGVVAGAPGLILRPTNAHAQFSQSPRLQKFVSTHLLRGVGGTGIPVAAPDGFQTFSTTYPTAATWTALHYTIDIGQFEDKLHPNLPNTTTLWGFGQNFVTNTQWTKHLGGIIAVKRGTPIQITFRNHLPSTHIIPVDATIPGAAQAKNRTAVHLHGGYVPWISDGGPHDWWAPDGTHGLSFLNNKVLQNSTLPTNEGEYYYPNSQGSRLVWYHDHAWGTTRTNAYAGIASGYVIYDDYELGLVTTANLPGPLDTRTVYLVFQDKIFVDPTNIGLLDPTWPLIMPSSKAGDLWYAHVYDPARWALAKGAAPPNPSVIPEFFGDTILVNGTVYPVLEVEQRQYRFRLLNACNARFLNPRLVYAQGATFPASTEPSPNVAGPPFIQIQSEGGFLPAPAMLNGPKQPLLLMAPAERGDFIVDFRAVPAGSILILYNDAPAPFPKGDPRNDYYPGNPKTPSSTPGYGPNTRTLLQIKVKTLAGAADPAITLPAAFTPTDPFLVAQTPGMPVTYTVNAAGFASIPLKAGGSATAFVRYLTLNEAFDLSGRLIQYLGTNVATGLGGPGLFGREYMDAPTEVVANGATGGNYEIWEIANLTADVHPIHFHLVNVQVLSRQPFSVKTYAGIPNYTGKAIAPDANELGWKETVRMNPGEVTRVFMKFDLPAVPFGVPDSPRAGVAIDTNPTQVDGGLGTLPAKGPGQAYNEYVWHCHILEHEEHDMMRPLVVIGENPFLNVTPPKLTVSLLAVTLPYTTAAFTVTSAVGNISVTQLEPTAPIFPVAINQGTQTFTVTIPGGTTAPKTVIFEIKDSGVPQASATMVLNITP